MAIDLRSDTVTRPSDAMRRAMAEASVGDDGWRSNGDVGSGEAALGLEGLRNTEVEDLDLTSTVQVRDEQVVRLQIPVNDTVLVDRGDPAARLNRVGYRLAERQRSPQLGLPPEVTTVEQLHDEVGRAVVEHVRVERLS